MPGKVFNVCQKLKVDQIYGMHTVLTASRHTKKYFSGLIFCGQVKLQCMIDLMCLG